MPRSISHRITALTSAIILPLTVSATLFPTSPAYAEGDRGTAREVALEAFAASHIPELYAQARRYVREVMVPIGEEFKSGKLTMPLVETMPKGPAFKAYFNELISFFRILDKSGDEFDIALAKSRDELTDDIAGLAAKHLSPDEVDAVRSGLNLTATRKFTEFLYKFYRLPMSFTYDEAYANVKFGTWIQEVIIQFEQRNGHPLTTAPSPERVAKATAIVHEFIVSARVDDMVNDSLRFVHETYLPLLDKEGKSEDIRPRIKKFEQQYPLQKVVLSATASSWLATMLSDEQLDELQKHMRGSGISKLYQVVFEAERAFTTFTVADAEAAKALADNIAAKGLFKERTPEQKALAEADANALVVKWTARFLAALTPATRDALVVSAAKLDELAKPLSDNPL